MTTTAHEDPEVQHQQIQTQDQAGTLAESARRHIAYERLARQVAASEAAARLVLDALARKQQASGEAAPEEETHDAKDHIGG